MVQILSEFEKRTEYMMLKEITLVTSVSINELKSGKLIIPGFVLKKMSSKSIDKLNEWLLNINNHLIVLPSWIDMDLEKIFKSSLPLKIKSMEETIYDDIPVKYKVDTMIKDKLFEQDGNIFGVNYRRNTGTGLVTVVTLPLLDYKLSNLQDKFKKILEKLFLFNKVVIEKKEIDNKDIVLEPMHINLIILRAAGIELNINLKQLQKKIFKYFYMDIPEKMLENKINELNISGFIIDDKLTNKANEVIEKKRLKPFIDVVNRKEVDSNEWE